MPLTEGTNGPLSSRRGEARRFARPLAWLPLLWVWALLPDGPSPTATALVPSAFTDSIPRTDSLAYPFLQLSQNQIGHPEALAAFFDRLRLLQEGRNFRVRIVHIGDSHIQADLFTGQLRTYFQERFGSAGRGMVFPFSLANSNNPVGLNASSPFPWEVRRSVFDPTDLPLGICGITLQTHTPGGYFRLALRPPTPFDSDNAFDRVTLFYESGDGFLPFALLASDSTNEAAGPTTPASARYHAVKKGETLYGLSSQYGCSVADLQRWNGLHGNRINVGQRLVVSYHHPAAVAVSTASALVPVETSADGATFSLSHPSRQLTVKAGGAGQSSLPGIFYGLLLENAGQPGILYHAIGVNGVTYRHYNEAERFWNQLPLLHPDLVIVSLGTNEALATQFDEAEFRGQAEGFLQRLRQWVPGCSILLSTNPDVLRARRYEHPGNLQVRRIILESAAANGVAVWDLHDIMGGHGSVRRWRGRQLAGADYIHFTKEGYQLQARLLFQALMDTYATRN